MAVTEVEERRWQERTMAVALGRSSAPALHWPDPVPSSISGKGCWIPSVVTSKEALAAGKSARRRAMGKTSGRRCQRCGGQRQARGDGGPMKAR
uniref:Uncharacterized protein n=1 Tax=Oryza barthii TaxID=65489 RepID=A0A0D3GR35_9ORYZ